MSNLSSNEVKERPIFFSAPMVRALLDGTKTQTRRIVKKRDVTLSRSAEAFTGDHFGTDAPEVMCPYGKVGDRLWVRETWSVCDTTPPPLDDDPEGGPYTGMVDVIYRATNEVRPNGVPHVPTLRRVPDHVAEDWQDEIERMEQEGDRWKPSIHMPRWASRITLEITEVRVQRLDEIVNPDAWAEGVQAWADTLTDFDFERAHRRIGAWPAPSPRQTYFALWEAINGAHSVEANPWVWCVSFKVLSTTPEKL